MFGGRPTREGAGVLERAGYCGVVDRRLFEDIFV